jgi:hypothetical protein
VDWDSNGKKDLVVGESYNGGRVRVYSNTGSDSAPAFSSHSFVQVGGSDFQVGDQAMPVVVDWNNDGKKDVLCGEIYGKIYYLENVGVDAVPVFSRSTFIQNNGANLEAGWRSAPVVCDWDSDGRKDLVIGSSDGRIRFYRNTGSDGEPAFSGYQHLNVDGENIDVGSYSRPDVFDWNGDGMVDLLVGNGDGNVRVFNALNPALPALSLVSAVVNDSSGDRDCRLDPGESAQIMVTISNKSATASNAVASLVSRSPNITVVSDSISFGDVPTGASVRSSLMPFNVTVAPGATPDGIYAFELAVSYVGDNWTSRHDLVVGSYMVDDNASFGWIDTSGGTVLSMPWWSSSQQVNLPFSFPFYGYDYSRIKVFAHGYVALDSDATVEYMNTPIPSPAAPENFIAAYWDLLDPATNSCTISYLHGGVAPDRYCAVEWNGIPRYGISGSKGNFQAILYESGQVKMQYGEMTPDFGYGGSATMGLEGPGGTCGLQYAYNQRNSVSYGKALLFSLNGGTADQDGNGMPDPLEDFYFNGPGQSLPGADDDGDGVSNENELRCSTDPLNADSALQVLDVSPSGADDLQLEWQYVPGKDYTLQRRADLGAGDWTDLVTSVRGGAWTVAVDQAEAWYRVVVE